MSTPDFFRSRLDQMIDLKRPLAVLATRLPKAAIEAVVAPKPSGPAVREHIGCIHLRAAFKASNHPGQQRVHPSAQITHPARQPDRLNPNHAPAAFRLCSHRANSTPLDSGQHITTPATSRRTVSDEISGLPAISSLATFLARAKP
jgi:hypothetical protein